MTTPDDVSQHYDRANLVQTLRDALAARGLGEQRLTARDLAPLDQFHSRGLAATVELARALPLDANTRVIDIGSGLGGPSRYLAETYGCAVQGVDLSQAFVEAATWLAERSGLSDKVAYQRGDALRLPFPASAFDLAWTQHVAMNIADRDGLYGEAFRVLRPGGRLAIFDVIAGPGGPLHYPAPWASGPEASFLLDADAMRAALEAQGFRIAAWVDCTEAGIAWFLEREAERAKAVPSPIAPSPLALGAIMGPDFAVATLNLRRNLQEGRAALVEVICEKD